MLNQLISHLVTIICIILIGFFLFILGDRIIAEYVRIDKASRYAYTIEMDYILSTLSLFCIPAYIIFRLLDHFLNKKNRLILSILFSTLAFFITTVALVAANAGVLTPVVIKNIIVLIVLCLVTPIIYRRVFAKKYRYKLTANN